MGREASEGSRIGCVRIQRTAHTKYSIYYHFVFVIKYRRKVLTNPDIEKRLKEIVREVATFHGWRIETINADQDHLHTFLSAPPRFAPSKIANLIKSWTQRQIRKEFPKIRQYLWGASFWSDGYFVSTVNDSTTAEQIRKYIQQQKDYQKQLRLWNIKRSEGEEIPALPRAGKV